MNFSNPEIKKALKNMDDVSEIYISSENGNDIEIVTAYWSLKLPYSVLRPFLPDRFNFSLDEAIVGIKYENKTLFRKELNAPGKWDLVKRTVNHYLNIPENCCSKLFDCNLIHENKAAILCNTCTDNYLNFENRFITINKKFLPILKIENGAEIFGGGMINPIFSVGKDGELRSLAMPMRHNSKFISILETFENLAKENF